jgi:predicted Rossmann-fold nucleotide-binding protein
MMSAFTKAAKKYDLRVGTINLVKAEEPQASRPNFFMPFSEDDLGIRQSTMMNASGVFMVFEGGLGTLCELYDSATRGKIDMRGRPILIIGSSDYQRQAYELIKKGIDLEKIPGYVLNSTYYLKHGSEVFDTLMGHYNFQRK